MTRASRRLGPLAARLLLVLGLLAATGAVAWNAYREPVRAAMRDYLSFRRVDKHAGALEAAAIESRVDPCLLAGLMIAESSGRVGARSNKDALGLFQLTMVSARWRAQELGLPEPTEQELLSDPLLNARLGADNLAWLLETYDGDVERALCAYNTGARRLKEITDAAGGWQAWRAERERSGDSELLAYARKVLRYRDEICARGAFPAWHEERPAGGSPEEREAALQHASPSSGEGAR